MTDTRRRLRSGTVILGSMGALAAALTACSSEPDKRCVDEDSYRVTQGYRVIDADDCKNGRSSLKSGWNAKGKSRSTGRASLTGDASWYYGGEEKKGWVDGGSFSDDSEGSGGSGGSYDDSDVRRGGFGKGHGGSGGG
ncbi:hypothetical protein [Streptomyces sp. NPDC047108]|uniref:hypothetical protein n=1 Tax=Streptomyces sp. NPDC047108 TaxID=3155025 RepID=UPI0033D948CE